MANIYQAVVKMPYSGYTYDRKFDHGELTTSEISYAIDCVIEEFLLTEGKEFYKKEEAFRWEHVFGNIPEELFIKHGLHPVEEGTPTSIEVYDGEDDDALVDTFEEHLGDWLNEHYRS